MATVCGFIQFIGSGRYTCQSEVGHDGKHRPRRDEAPAPHRPDRMTDAPDPVGNCPSCGEHDTSTPCRYR